MKIDTVVVTSGYYTGTRTDKILFMKLGTHEVIIAWIVMMEAGFHKCVFWDGIFTVGSTKSGA